MLHRLQGDCQVRYKTLTMQVCSTKQALNHVNLNDKAVLSGSNYIVLIDNSAAHAVTAFHIFTAYANDM